jgi:hypothetical protein
MPWRHSITAQGGKMKTTICVILGVLALSTIYLPAFATETGTMICTGGIVSLGHTAGEVVSKCGQPATTTQRELKHVEEGVKGSRDRTVTTISIDDWIFNFGPNQFQYQLVLENGKVARIESLGYGY